MYNMSVKRKLQILINRGTQCFKRFLRWGRLHAWSAGPVDFTMSMGVLRPIRTAYWQGSVECGPNGAFLRINKSVV